MTSTAALPLPVMSTPPRSAAASTAVSPLTPASTSSATIALTIGSRVTHPPPNTPSSRTAAPHQHQQPQQQQHSHLLFRPHPSLPHTTPATTHSLSTSSAFASQPTTSVDPTQSTVPAIPFFVAASTTSSAASGSLSASAHSAFASPSAAAPLSSAVAGAGSAVGVAGNSAINKRISFCSATPTAAPAMSTRATVIPSDDWHRLLQSSRQRVDKRAVSDIVLQWLVQEGYADVADRFEAEALLKADRPSADIEERTAIRKLILCGDVAAAVSRCNALYPAMLDQPCHAALSFMAQQQTLIELIRCSHIDTALAFARQELAPRAQHQPALMLELEKTMSLLAFAQPAAAQSPYGVLLSQQRRHAVSSAFNAALLQQQQQQLTVQPHSAAAALASSTTAAAPLSSLQPAASDLVRLVQRLQCLQPQLACTYSYPALSIACKPSAAITASGVSAGSGSGDGIVVDGVTTASQRSNSVVSASPLLSPALLSPVATRTPVTMPMPSRSVGRHQLPSPFLLSSSAQPSVPPSPVLLSATGPVLSSGGMSPGLSGVAASRVSSFTSLSASSSRRSSVSTPSAFVLPLPAASSSQAAGRRSSASSGGSSSGSRGGSSGSAQSSQRGQQQRRNDDDDMVT